MVSEFCVRPDGPFASHVSVVCWTTTICCNYTLLQSLCETCYEQTHDPETRATIVCVRAQMESFGLFFSVHLAHTILSHTDNLSRTLCITQHKYMSVSEGQTIAAVTVDTLFSKRSDKAFKEFWEAIYNKLENVNMGEHVVSRRRKVP